MVPEFAVDQSGAWVCHKDLSTPATAPPPPYHVSLRPQICRYSHFANTSSELGFDFFGFGTELAGNAATRTTLRPSTSLGLGSQYFVFLFSERRCSRLIPRPRVLRSKLFVALRSLHSSKPTSSNDAPLFSTNPNEPITTIAERGSTQLSVREPQNKAGTCHPDILGPRAERLTRFIFWDLRVRLVDVGQDCQLG